MLPKIHYIPQNVFELVILPSQPPKSLDYRNALQYPAYFVNFMIILKHKPSSNLEGFLIIWRHWKKG